MRKFVLAAAACATFAGSADAAGTPVYTSTAFSSMANPSENAWCSGCGGAQQVVDAFSLASATVLAGADTAIQSDYGSDWNIKVSLYDSSFNVVESVTFTPGSYSLTALQNDVSEIKFTLPNWSVGAGDYFIGFSDFTLGVPGYNVGDSESQYNLDYRTTLFTSAALQLTSTVPEASSLPLVLAGLAAMGVGLRRRRA